MFSHHDDSDVPAEHVFGPNAEPSDAEPENFEGQRLQRLMAAAGIGSRRECELLILEGRVEVDGQIVATLGVKVDPNIQNIFVDGEPIKPQRLEYYMLNKPPGVVSTTSDPGGRARVIDLIKSQQRVYNVGRLDQSSEGLILVTNDGELANRLTHPRYGIEKRYSVLVDGVPTREQLRELEAGVYIAEGKAKASEAKIVKRSDKNCWLEIVLSEGRNREIRRLLAKIEHKVRVLRRIAIGPLKMADLPLGAHRRLRNDELKLLRQVTGLAPDAKKSASSTKTSHRSSTSASPGKKTPFKRKSQDSRKKSGADNRSGKPKEVRPQTSDSISKSAAARFTSARPKNAETSTAQQRPNGKKKPAKYSPQKKGAATKKSVTGRNENRNSERKTDRVIERDNRHSTDRKGSAKKKSRTENQRTVTGKRRVNPKGRSR